VAGSTGPLSALLLLLKSHMAKARKIQLLANPIPSTRASASKSAPTEKIRAKLIALVHNSTTAAAVLRHALDALFIGWTRLGGTPEELTAVRVRCAFPDGNPHYRGCH
jgi:hypothetical protein